MPARRELTRQALLGASAAPANGVVSVALAAWLAALGVGPGAIGLLGLAALPWTLKPLWAPLLDRYGRRRIWILGAQIATVLALGGVALSWGGQTAGTIVLLATAVAFAGATLDLAIDGWRVATVPEHDREAATGAFVLGYRVAFLGAGAAAIPIAAYAGVPSTLACAAAIVALGAVVVLRAPEGPHDDADGGAGWLAAWWAPITRLARPEDAGYALGVVALFKLGELPLATLGPAFLVASGVPPGTIGFAQAVAIGATIVGALGAAPLAGWRGPVGALIVAGALAAGTNLGYAALALGGGPPDAVSVIFVVGLDGLASGLSSACFVAFLMGRCDARWAAAGYAVLTALSGLAGRVATPAAGALAEVGGFRACFVATAFAGIPALALATRVK